MARLTRKKDQYPCRIAGGCPVEDWLIDSGAILDDSTRLCDNCPIEKYINKLAEYEDKEEDK